MISELDRILELGKLITQRSGRTVQVTLDINCWSAFKRPLLNVWIWFYDGAGEISAFYHYEDEPYTLNILMMLFNELKKEPLL